MEIASSDFSIAFASRKRDFSIKIQCQKHDFSISLSERFGISEPFANL